MPADTRLICQLRLSGLNDGATKIFLNAAGEQDDISKDLKAFLDYLRGVPSEHPYVTALEQAVRKAKMNREWSFLYNSSIGNSKKEG